MFSGIVEETGVVRGIKTGARSIRLEVLARHATQGINLGDSLAVNGCCLTVVGVQGRGRARRLEFDLLRETWIRTNLQVLGEGSLVNLERSLPADGRIHGHFVTGHIDGLGTVKVFEKRGADWFLEIGAPPEIMSYVVFKGAIAVDGISLTVAAVAKKSFSIWIIPHTYEVTALQQRKKGDAVNLEADILAKYVEKLVRKV